MTTHTPVRRRPLRRAGRFLLRALLVVLGTAGGLFCYFVCQGMFSGYPKYHTDLLSTIGLLIVMAVGALAWILDHRRIDDDD
ncbi:hypothetical protein OOK27_22395 [Streptomyces canus]|uniref:hypothetical protein n=1 Tax=Streptomyces canus TaxID=58343 RepID=UPI0022523C95|nr:hypothetical protein [Streptomyces canus]MCX5256848.1 hypothetical protein [Streptomyces canus]